MTPVSRFTLFHSSLPVEGLVVENPIGWETAVISLERHKDYHSLIEDFKGNFMWYGLGMSTLKSFSINDIVRLEIDLSYKAGIWTNLFIGQPKLPQQEEIIIADREAYKMTVPIIRDDFWTKFINRKDSQVNLEGAVDIDGNARTPISKIVLPMPSQVVRQRTDGILEASTALYAPWNLSDVFQVSVDSFPVDEIEQNFYVQIGKTTASSVFPTHRMRFKGNYSFDISFECSVIKDIPDIASPPVIGSKIFYLQVNDDTPVAFTETQTIVSGSGGTAEGYNTYSLSHAVALEIGDEVKLYADTISTIAFSHEWLFWGVSDYTSISTATLYSKFPGQLGSFFNIEADTIAPDTNTDAFLIKDAAESIISKLVGQDAAVKSDYLDTCKGENAIFRGKHIRGYDFATKQFSMSFEEWWKGANPLLFLGLGYTEVAGVKKIEIEERAHFFNSTPVVNISNVNKLVRRHDLERIYKSIEIGYKKSLSESDSGIDDPQTKRFFNTDFHSIGVKETILCEWMAASLAIERSRRNRVELGKDDRNDEEIMVVALVEDGDDWLPEFGTVFNAVTNLLNPDFRINIRHSATRLFKRAQSWFNGCMLYSTTGVFTFNRGEGNYEMTSQLEDSDCEAVAGTEPIIDEGANITADTTDILFVPQIWEAESVPMAFSTYQDIVANKNNALGISRTSTGHVPMHILDLGFEIHESRANLLLLQATENEP